MISASLTTILTGIIVKISPEFTGITLEKKSFYIMMFVGVGLFFLALDRL